MDEVWKDVIGYEGLYQVSNKGRVKSLITPGKKRHHMKEMILKQTYDNYGYLQLNLHKNGTRCSRKVHRLVATAFIEKPDCCPLTVNHKDGVKTNNSVYNLEWCTNRENLLHAHRNGLINNKGENSSTARPVLQYSKNGEFIKRWCTAKQAFIELKINGSHIGQCCRNERKSAGGFVWKYEIERPLEFESEKGE